MGRVTGWGEIGEGESWAWWYKPQMVPIDVSVMVTYPWADDVLRDRSDAGRVVSSLAEFERLYGRWSERPMIFDALERYFRPPWWARGLAWAIAAWYAVRR